MNKISTGTAARICGCTPENILYHIKHGNLKAERFSDAKKSWWMLLANEVHAFKLKMQGINRARRMDTVV